MFRISLQAYKSRGLAQRNLPTNSLTNFSRTPLAPCKYKSPSDPPREVCPPPPRPTPPPKGERVLKRTMLGTLTAAVLAGSFAVYAKDKPEVRDWLTINAPWFDDLIAIAYQENDTYSESATICMTYLKNYFTSYMNRPKECRGESGTPVVKPCAMKPATPVVEERQEIPIVEAKEEDNEDKPPCVTLAPLSKDICEIEACLKDLGESAINNYLTARDACIVYNKSVEAAMLKFNPATLNNLQKERDERLQMEKTYFGDGFTAQSQFNDLTRYLECGLVKGPQNKIDVTKAMLKAINTNISIVKMQYTWENDKALAIDSQMEKLKLLIDKYADENKTYYPSLNYEDKKASLGGADMDFLLIHTMKYVKQLEAEVYDALGPMTERVGRALETLPKPQDEKQKKASDANLQNCLKKSQEQLASEYENRYKQLKESNDKELKDALAKQAKRHEDNIALLSAQKRAEVTTKFNKMVAEMVAREKHLLKEQLADVSAKLTMVENKLNEQLIAERENKRSLELYTAGSSLLAATKKGEPSVKVEKELRAIEKASSDGDKLVLSVLHAIPDGVWDKGVVPESVLRDKYHKMEQVALQVALVEEDGAPLPLYLLSWLQSTLLFMKFSTIPQAELDNPPTEPFKNLDTFDLLQRARYWVDRGNIAAALRYVSSLEGASRIAAASWQDAARSHLETRQAAEAILAHAAALGLRYI